MIVFGEYHKDIVGKFDIFNLSSLVEGFNVISIVPPFIKDFNDERQFDISYAEYLLSNDKAFYEMMKVVMSIYSGNNVYILISRDNGILDIIANSFQKFLQQRYGIISSDINTIEDLEYMSDIQQFNIQGLYNLDMDKERFCYIYYTINPNELRESD